mgnify:CR=1 FL=1
MTTITSDLKKASDEYQAEEQIGPLINENKLTFSEKSCMNTE